MKKFLGVNKHCLASSYIRGRDMLKHIIVLVILAVMCFTMSSCEAKTYEEARINQVKAVMATNDGAKIKHAVNKYSTQYKVDPILIYAIILTESGFNKNATSSAGAKGLMQLMPGTFSARNVGHDIYDIDHNIHAGTKHTAGLLAKYNGNIYLALSAYLTGGGYTDKFNGEVPPCSKQYVNRVLHHREILKSILI